MLSPDEKAFIRRFCMRTRRARLARRLTQSQVAEKLEISRRAYQNYELCTPLPHHLIEEFAETTGISIDELFCRGAAYGRERTGGGENPRVKDVPIYTAGSRNVPLFSAVGCRRQIGKKARNSLEYAGRSERI